MKVEVIRQEFAKDYTLSKIYVDDAYECYGLEPGFPTTDSKGRIPNGEYKLIIDYSNRFKKDMPHVLDVQGFTGIRIHPGNTEADTEGCLLLGQSTNGVGTVYNSKIAWNAFMNKLVDAINDRKEDVIICYK